MFLFIRMKMMLLMERMRLFIRMKMRVWRRMEVEPVFAHRGEMTLGWKTPQSSLKFRNHHHGQKLKSKPFEEERKKD